MKARLFETLVLSCSRRPAGPRRVTVPLSLGVHALVVGAVLSLPFWTAAELPEPSVRPSSGPLVASIARVAPPRPTPAPPVRAARPAPARPLRSQLPGPSIAIPREDPDGLPAPDTGMPLDPHIPLVDGSGCPDCTGSPEPGVEGVGLPGPGDGSTPVLVRMSERDVRAPRKLHHVAPRYPELALRAHVQGKVVVECTIDTHGRIANVRLVSGHPLLDGAALEAVGQWAYTPTLLDGVPVAVLMNGTIDFKLAR